MGDGSAPMPVTRYRYRGSKTPHRGLQRAAGHGRRTPHRRRSATTAWPARGGRSSRAGRHAWTADRRPSGRSTESAIRSWRWPGSPSWLPRCPMGPDWSKLDLISPPPCDLSKILAPILALLYEYLGILWTYYALSVAALRLCALPSVTGTVVWSGTRSIGAARPS